MTTSRIPVTILTGFLGSGKTTLLNHILKSQHGKRIAVIENEYGEVGVNGDLILNAGQEIFETQNGCLCCTVRGDLARIFHELITTKKDQFDMVLVETTGMANPGPVLQTILTDDQLLTHYRIDAVVTMVDAHHISLHLTEKMDKKTEAYQQIAFADVILLNKTDLIDNVASPDALNNLTEQLRTIKNVPIYPTKYGIISLDCILDLGGFDLERIDGQMDLQHHQQQHGSSTEGIMSVGMDMEGALDFDRLNRWIQSILASIA
ncbi:unnamed protein product [Absidia cylindrospora]